MSIKDAIMNQCIRLMSYLEGFANSRPVDEVKTATIGLVAVLGNLRLVNIILIFFI